MNRVIDKLAWIVIKDGKLLTVRSKGKELFYLPGGKREVGESDKQALIREIKEELSVDLIEDTITYVETFTAQADGKPQGISVQLTCYLSEFTGELQPDEEIEEFKFVSIQDEAICSLATIVALKWLKSESRL